jgi:hypothetical protein
MRALRAAALLALSFSAAALSAQEPGRPLDALGLPGFLAQPVTVQKGDTVGSLLRSLRIQPDGNSLAAVYALNPQLARVKPLRPGSQLLLPQPKSQEAGAAEWISLQIVPDVKRDLLAAAESLNDLVEPLNALPAARFGDPDKQGEVLGALDEIRGYLDQVNLILKQNKLPLGPELLRQSLAETRAVQQALEDMTRRKVSLDRKSRELIVGVSEDLNLKAQSFDDMDRPDGPLRWHDVDVVVNLFHRSDRKPATGLRVFYVNQLFKDRPEWVRPFPGVGARVQDKLLEGDYVFWAAEIGKTAPATQKVSHPVRKGEKAVEIDLPVKP